MVANSKDAVLAISSCVCISSNTGMIVLMRVCGCFFVRDIIGGWCWVMSVFFSYLSQMCSDSSVVCSTVSKMFFIWIFTAGWPASSIFPVFCVISCCHMILVIVMKNLFHGFQGYAPSLQSDYQPIGGGMLNGGAVMSSSMDYHQLGQHIPNHHPSLDWSTDYHGNRWVVVGHPLKSYLCSSRCSDVQVFSRTLWHHWVWLHISDHTYQSYRVKQTWNSQPLLSLLLNYSR